jgi:hypothetical protein
MIKLGSRAKDTITGFQGIVTGRCEYLYGCSQLCIRPEKLKDGQMIEAQWIDEQRIILVKELKIKVSQQSTATSGGPQQYPKDDKFNSQ